MQEEAEAQREAEITKPTDLQLLTEEQIALLSTSEEPETLEELTVQSEKRPHYTPILLRLTRRAVIFFTLLLLAFIGFYIAGCAQGFLDNDIILILLCISSVAILLLLFSVATLIECIIFLIAQRRIYFLFYAVPFTLTAALGAVATVVSRSINLLARGI